MLSQFSLSSVTSPKKTFERYLPQMVYGAFDGTVTTFAIVAAATGAHLSAWTVVILGLANLFADGVSMSVGAYLSVKGEHNGDRHPVSMSVWTFLAFVVVGFTPVAPYIFGYASFPLSCAFTGIAFFAIGAAKGYVQKRSIIREGLQSLILGAITACIAYGVGAGLSAL